MLYGPGGSSTPRPMTDFCSLPIIKDAGQTKRDKLTCKYGISKARAIKQKQLKATLPLQNQFSQGRQQDTHYLFSRRARSLVWRCRHLWPRFRAPCDSSWKSAATRRWRLHRLDERQLRRNKSRRFRRKLWASGQERKSLAWRHASQSYSIITHLTKL